jgi:hypothetical protein
MLKFAYARILGSLLFSVALAACGSGGVASNGGAGAGSGGGDATGAGGEAGGVEDAGATDGRGGVGGGVGSSDASGSGGLSGAGGQGAGCPDSGSVSIFPTAACMTGTQCMGIDIVCDCVSSKWDHCRRTKCQTGSFGDPYACFSEVTLPAGCSCMKVPAPPQNVENCICTQQ